MKRTLLILSLLIVLPLSIFAQKWKANSSYVKFYSDAPMEKIEAINEKSGSVVDLSSGDIVFSIPISQFQFEKSLMQEHFNENYLESDKYPKATFKGKLKGYDASKTGKQKATAVGTMNIHGVDQKVEIEGDIEISDSKMHMESVFPIEVADYKIKIPSIVFYNIAEVVEVTIKFDYEKL